MHPSLIIKIVVTAFFLVSWIVITLTMIKEEGAPIVLAWVVGLMIGGGSALAILIAILFVTNQI